MIRLVTRLALCAAVAARAQVVPAPQTPQARIAEVEASGASFPRAADASSAPPRACMIVPPDRIMFPTTRGNPEDYSLRSGEFFAGSISFGWGATYEQAKLPLTPRHPDAIGNGLRLIVTRIDPPGETLVTVFPPNGSGRTLFFPTWPTFPTPGRWLILATAGVNWGCFVIERPVK